MTGETFCDDLAVNKLAEQLALLRTEYSNGSDNGGGFYQNHNGDRGDGNRGKFLQYDNGGYGIMVPAGERSLYTSSGGNDNSFYSPTGSFDSTGFSFFGSGDMGQSIDPFGQYEFSRKTDTPSTWPCSANSANPSPPPQDRHRFGIPASTTTFFMSGGGEPIHFDLDEDSTPYPMTDRDADEWRRALKPPVPGMGYTCRICLQSDHFVQNCPRAPPRSVLKTPYQGHNQCYGIFTCQYCDRSWGSYRSFAELGQCCKICQRFTFPEKQYPLDKIPPSKLKQLQKAHGKRHI